MSLEDRLSELTAAIVGLTAAFAAQPGAVPVEAASPPPSGRRKASASPAAASDTTGDSTSGSADAPPSAPAGTSAPVIDAGTGKPVEIAEVDRAAVKQLGLQLTTKPGGTPALNDILKRHVPQGQEVKFGNVPDAAIPQFQADVEAAIAQADAMAD